MYPNNCNKNRLSNLTNLITLCIILVSGSIARFYNFFEIPFTHDEFSALFRTQFNSFAELIEKGVTVDGHPAGIQVFLYYWTNAVGWSEPLIKLPFILTGILSVLLFYQLAKEWYNDTVALVSAAFLSSIQYTVIHSQVARPYITGLFFCLLLVFFWTKLVKNPDKNFKRNLAFYILSTVLCAYNHYFSLLFAGIVNISILFFIKKKQVRAILLSWIISILLFIPHLGIFFRQVAIGGIGDWLGKPKPGFIIEYLRYIFQFSPWVYALVIFLVVFGFVGNNLKAIHKKYFILAVCWFFLPLIIGYSYSVFIDSVLHYAVLIFSFPFLFFILFGHLKPKNAATNLFLVVLIITVNSFVLIYGRKHYQLFYNSAYSGILKDYKEAKILGKANFAIIESHPGITDYYCKKMQIERFFLLNPGSGSEPLFYELLTNKAVNNKNLFYACVSGNDAQIVPLIMDFYPYIEMQKNYASGTSYIFSKDKGVTPEMVESYKFEIESPLWTNFNPEMKICTDSVNKLNSYRIDSLTEWSPTYSASLDQLIKNPNTYIDISVRVFYPETACKALLVAEIRQDGEIIYWNSRELAKSVGMDLNHNQWAKIHLGIRLNDIDIRKDHLKFRTFVWNRNKQNLIINNFTISTRKGNPLIYGLIKKI